MSRYPYQTFFMHRDEYERHKFCVDHLKPLAPLNVLDIGGTQLLKRFFITVKIVSLNIDNSGDVQYEGGVFPYEDHSYDAVVSLDTLEHIPKASRVDFIRECLRVASRGVIIAAPYGSISHMKNEADLCSCLEQNRHPNRWLAEHVQNGLPTSTEISAYKSLFEDNRYDTDIYYAGDYLWQSQNIKLAIRLSRFGLPDRMANLVSFVLVLHIWNKNQFSTQPTQLTNRFYLFGTKTSNIGENIGPE